MFPLLLCVFLFSSCAFVSTSSISSAEPGEVLFQDDFSDNTSGWDRVLAEGGIMDYDSGGYRILVRQPKLNFWSTPGKEFRDVRVEVDVTKLNGPDENRVGLICRYRNGDYYFFIISNDGYYAIGKFIGGQTLLLGQNEMRPSEFIQTGAANHLRADCVGNTLTFYVNYNQVASTQDSDFPSGDVGVLAGAFNEPGVDVLFEHFVVIQP
ncbi:MAG TPA: hypothetical protein VNK49_13605 [Anaerolineales bacterium]|nr:hypothetical protein [Anaerolineales bacterium]